MFFPDIRRADAFVQFLIFLAESGFLKRHHVLVIVALQVSVRKARTVEKIEKCLLIGRVDAISGFSQSFRIQASGFFRQPLKKVKIFPVHRRYAGRVFSLFHAAFDLQRVNACSIKFRQQAERVQVLQAQQIFVVSRVQPAPVLIVKLVAHAAALRTAAAVSGASADD